MTDDVAAPATFLSSLEDPALTTTIRLGAGVTLVNVFTCRPGQQRAFADAQIAEYRRLAGRFPGQLTVNLHLGLDGVHCVNYAHFADVESYRAWRDSPEFGAHVEVIAPYLEKVEPGLYEVAYIQHDAG